MNVSLRTFVIIVKIIVAICIIIVKTLSHSTQNVATFIVSGVNWKVNA